jgi:hypothetical protein
MEASVAAGFLLEDDFSPHALTFLPGLNCVLACSREGKTACIDVVNGVVQRCPGMWAVLLRCSPAVSALKSYEMNRASYP